jgi:hypothetical protein
VAPAATVLCLFAAGAAVAGASHRARAASPPVAAPSVALSARPSRLQPGGAVVLSGRVSDPLGRRLVDVYASASPYSTESLLTSLTAAADGSFSLSATPDRNARYRVVLGGTNAQATVSVGVIGTATVVVKSLSLGRAGVTITASHPRDLKWGGALVRWSFQTGSRGAFMTAPASRTRDTRPGVTTLGATVTLPAGRFSFRACFTARGDTALVDPHRPPGCSGRGYSGSGTLPAGFPSPQAVSGAASYLGGRIGRTAFAVVDSEGRVSGLHIHWTFPTASVVKAMLLVSYLRRLHAQGQHLVDGYSNSILYPMIHVSDNNAATTVWSIVGDGALYSLARRAGMTDFSVTGGWGTALLSPFDQARYLFSMDSMIPPEFRGYARFLLSTIEPSQSWSIPAVARPHHYAVFFKDGSEPTGLGQLVHQVARLERPDRTFAMAVMTDGDPSMQYGEDTISGVAQALVNAP